MDALVVAFQVELSAETAARLAAAADTAAAHGRAEIEVGGCAFALARSRKLDFFPFENADVRLVFDCQGQGGWTLEVVVRAVFLATHDVCAALALAERVATGFGKNRGARLRRVDLCADFTDFLLSASDVERLFTTRSRTATFLEDAKDIGEVGERLSGEALRVFRNKSRAVTGISVSPGNPLSARLYNKTEELGLPGRTEKRQIEEARWRRHDWNGGPVTRFELQLRGEALDEFDLRSPEMLLERIDGVWKRGVEWVRLVDPTTATRLSRCVNDPRWDPVAAVVFVHEAVPGARKRNRGGASVDQVLGAARSRLASVGVLSRIGEHVSEYGEVLTHDEYAARLSKDEARVEVGRYLADLFSRASEDVGFQLAGEGDWNSALARLLVRNDAACARFSSADDSQPRLKEAGS